MDKEIQSLVDEWVKEHDLIECPLCSIISRDACKKRQKKTPHYRTDWGDVAAESSMLCQAAKCEHYKK